MARRKVEPHWLTGTAFKLSIQCNNAAFDGEHMARTEIVRILRDIANEISTNGLHDAGMYQTIHDINGNDVGRYALKDVAANGNETFPQILKR